MTRPLFTALLILALAAPAAAEPQTFGWSCHGQDMPYLRRVIARAPEFGVNMLQLCQFLAKHGGNLPENEPEAANLREIARLGKEKGVDVYLWVWEINGVPKARKGKGRLNLDDPALWEWMAGKYRTLFDAAPDLAGLILTLRECDYPVQDNEKVTSAMSETRRVAKVVETLHGVCRERGKRLYVRDFSVTPDEMTRIVEAVGLMPPDVAAMTKGVARDFHAYLPDNPALGAFGDRRQIVEFDLAGEGNGQGTVPYFVASEVRRRWQNARAKGVAGAVARIDRFDARIFDTLDDANTYAYASIVREGADAEAAARRWCDRRFGAAAADVLARCLLRTYDISNRTFFVLRFQFLVDATAVPDLKCADTHIESASNAAWIPGDKATELELLNPTLKTIERAEAEKDESIRLANLNLEELEGVRSTLKPEDYDWVRSCFQRSLDFAKLWKAMAGAYLAGRMCIADRSEDARAQAERRLADFGRATDAFEATYGKDFSIGEVSRKPNHVVPECRALLAEIRDRVENGTPPAPRRKPK